MRVSDVEPTPTVTDPKQLMGLVQFLAGRAEDTNARKSIDKGTFIKLAHNLGIKITDQTLPGLISQPPLSNVLEPMDPQNPNTIYYKGAEVPSTQMSVPQAQQVVSKMAKSAMNRMK